MEYNNYNRKKRHLTTGERANIELMLKQKKKPTEIARELGRDRSVITREIKRNSIEQLDSELRKKKRYFADAANRQYNERRSATGCKIKLVLASEMVQYTEERIKKEKWSPDAAIGRARIEHPEWVSISTKTFYNYIDMGIVNIKPIDLQLKVKLQPKKRRIISRKKVLGKSISERPEEVNDRQTIGHWEMDTVVGKREKSSVLLTMTERVTGVEIIRKIASKSSEDVMSSLKEIKKQFESKFKYIFSSITCDNGSEFSDSEGMEKILGIPVYYAHPYSACERGTNENHNGIICRFIPKGKSIDDIQNLLSKESNLI